MGNSLINPGLVRAIGPNATGPNSAYAQNLATYTGGLLQRPSNNDLEFNPFTANNSLPDTLLNGALLRAPMPPDHSAVPTPFNPGTPGTGVTTNRGQSGSGLGSSGSVHVEKTAPAPPKSSTVATNPLGTTSAILGVNPNTTQATTTAVQQSAPDFGSMISNAVKNLKPTNLGVTKGLGDASLAAGILGGANTIPTVSSALTGILGPTAEAMIPFVGPALAVGTLIASMFHGANPLQVPAADIEQAFEGTSDNLNALGAAGYLTPQQVQDADKALITQGDNLYSSYAPQLGSSFTKPMQRGEQNMANVINAEANNATSGVWGNVIPKAYDPAKAASLLMGTNIKGWNPGSLQSANEITNALLSGLFPSS